MPFKCVNCDKVVQEIEDVECECSNPKFLKTAMVHLLEALPEGSTEKAYCTQKTTVGLPPNQKQVKTKLKVCCTSPTTTRAPIVTTIKSQVTCPACIQYLSEVVSQGTEV